MKRGEGKRRNTDERRKSQGRDKARPERGGARPGRPGGGKSGKRDFDRKPNSRKQEGRFRDDKQPSSRYGKKDDGRNPGGARIRLNRYIANAGVCSRREADEHITAGKVTVNGKVVQELGTKVRPSDQVRFKGELLQLEEKVYVLLNKPKNYISTTDDPEDRNTVLDLIRGASYKRLYPVGRLDRNTTGVLLLTNDGELTQKLTHPSREIPKIYDIELNKPLEKGDLQQLVDGIQLPDGFVAADAASYVDPSQKSRIGLKIHSGKNRVVRRMFEHLGYEVKKLDRTAFAGLTKKDVKRGHWRYLSKKEVNILYMMPSS